MNFLQRIIYTFLKIKERGLKLRLDKHFKTSATNSTSKTVISGNCSLTLNTETNKNIELVKKTMHDLIKNANFSSAFLFEFIKKRNVKIVYLKNCHKLLSLLGEEQGLILERSGFDAFILNLLSNSGISFHSKPLLILEKNNTDFYFLLFQTYKLVAFMQKLPGLDEKSQKLFKIYSKQPEKCDITKLALDEMTSLKEAIARDNEASTFVIEYSKTRDGAKKVISKMQDGGANL